MKAGYILVLELGKGQEISVGGLGRGYFPRGFYVYCGSISGGRRSRKGKKRRWHIDYLAEKAEIQEVIICEAEESLECLLSPALSKELTHIPGFGSSDCHCRSHLFFCADREMMMERLSVFLARLGLTPESHRVAPLSLWSCIREGWLTYAGSSGKLNQRDAPKLSKD